MDRLGDDDRLLSTISEEDSESVKSNSMHLLSSLQMSGDEVDKAASSVPPASSTTVAASVADNGDHEMSGGDNDRKEKKKKKKVKPKDGFYSENIDAAQQILVDLCSEMKELKTSIQQESEKTNAAMMGNLSSNNEVVKSLSEQMALLQGNMKQLDQVIESKATPAQIEELARIRAVQEMLRVAVEDKDKTVEIYELHARRGYEEIERLRKDLERERKEVATLRAEIDIMRAQKIDLIKNGAMANGSASVGGGRVSAPGRMGSTAGSTMSFDDDLTLETKGSYDTAAYEMKSLKKRVIHMKKKLAVAQVEAKEAAELRAEVERIRVVYEAEKKKSLEKDETIKRLQNELNTLKIKAATESTYPHAKQHTKKNTKWWQNL